MGAIIKKHTNSILNIKPWCTPTRAGSYFAKPQYPHKISLTKEVGMIGGKQSNASCLHKINVSTDTKLYVCMHDVPINVSIYVFMCVYICMYMNE